MTYPLTAFNFIVEIDGFNSIGVTEVSGLSASVEVVEYREGSDVESFVLKMPGLSKVSNVILKRGISKGNNDFYDWFNSINQKTNKRNIAIKLLDEDKNVVIAWLLKNAFPVKINYTGLKALSSEIAFEELEIACESLTVQAV